MRRPAFLILLICVMMVFGCQMHGVWKDAKDRMVGTKFDPAQERNQQTRSFYARYYPKGSKFYYRVDQEPPNLRYYIQWSPQCRYSLLVDPDGTILSWRYEDVKDPSWDCVTS
jgi:hypothetical protein